MKRNKEFLYLVLAILCVWCPLFMAAWDKDKPSSSTSLRNSNPEILANWSALETSFGAFHEYSTGGSNTGENLSIKFNTPISTPTNAANKSFLYEKDVSAVVELHWLDESGNELQMTSGGDLFSSAGLTVTSASTFNGSITLGAGDDLIGSATSDITFNTDKFTVAGDTGNTLIAGTLDVTGVATLGDASLLKTSAAPTTDAMIANKKYVDDEITSAVAGTGFWKTSSTTVFNTTLTAANTFQDLDLSAQVGTNSALVFLEVSPATGGQNFALKPKGQGSGTYTNHINGTSGFSMGGCVMQPDGVNNIAYMTVATDSSGVIQIGASSNTNTYTIKLLGYVK